MGATIPKGTTAGYYLRFISDMLDIMDGFLNMKGFHIVMDNTPIHSLDAIDPIIKEREYIPLYLPPYSPELNPIEIFWKVLRDRVKRDKLIDVETLTSRLLKEAKMFQLRTCKISSSILSIFSLNALIKKFYGYLDICPEIG